MRSLISMMIYYKVNQYWGSGSGIRSFLPPRSRIWVRDEFFQDPGSFRLWLRLRLCSWNLKTQEKSKFAFHVSCWIWDLGPEIRDKKMFGTGSWIRDKTSRNRNTKVINARALFMTKPETLQTQWIQIRAGSLCLSALMLCCGQKRN
jgi:hypothetical protein